MSNGGVIIFIMLLLLVLAIAAFWMDVRDLRGRRPCQRELRGFEVMPKDEAPMPDHGDAVKQKCRTKDSGRGQ